MSQRQEINYEAMVDRAITDFHAVRRLWPVRRRLALWIILEASILVLTAFTQGYTNLPSCNFQHLLVLGLFILMSIAAAFLALRSAIPGCEVARSELVLLLVALCVTFFAASEPPMITLPFRELVQAGVFSTFQLYGLAALPWLALFWAVRRGVPSQPMKTGLLIGTAAFCFGLAAQPLVSHTDRFPHMMVWPALSGILLIIASSFAGEIWLNWIARWQRDDSKAEAWRSARPLMNAAAILAVACTASFVALIFVLRGARENFIPVADFDLTIAQYRQSLVEFHPNVPSSSIEAVVTAYVEHGMPAYMWDFGNKGFRLVGGRWELLPDGTPLTYTWFRGPKGGVICMFRQSDGFNPPSVRHEEHQHLLFYPYRGFSICLINVGGYGTFISVIAAKMPMDQFVPLVLAAAF